MKSPGLNRDEHLDNDLDENVRIQRVRLTTALDNLMGLGLLYREIGRKYRDKYFLSTLGFEFVAACRQPRTKRAHPAADAGPRNR